jgi:type II secretory ATPase GspE/PulE/Tfp pilus assembly ATPase PilB-like protein
MTEREWARLRRDFAGSGFKADEMPDASKDLHSELALANKITAEDALEWVASVYQMLPLDPSRTSCSTHAEALFRRIAVASEAEDPWMPLGNIGPLLIFAHYNPACVDFWQVPVELIIPVLIPQSKYALLKADILQRLNFSPLEQRAPLSPKRSMPRGEGPRKVLEWLLEEYPFEDAETKARLEDVREKIPHDTLGGLEALKSVPRQMGVALHHFCTGDPCFNAESAPSQKIFPEALLEKHAVYPMYVGRKIVYLLATDRNNFAFEDEWLSSGHDAYDFRTVICDRDSILAAISRERGRSASTTVATNEGELTFSDVANLVEIDPLDVQKINPNSINTTPEQVVHWVLHRAITGRGSDLHIEKFYNTARFRARIDGELKVIHSCPEEMLSRYISLIKNYSNMGQRRQDAQDGRFSLIIGKRRVDCRVSAIPCRKDLQKITIRFLDKQDGVKKLTQLNLSPRQTSLLGDAMGRDQGLILVTGPTGSGKTTTLYALLNSINSDNVNIHTIEDPIEYEIEGMNQTQIDPHNQINFAEGLRRLMRADPDVILIGECRDEETATAALNAALTGHLVLTTLHANDCLRAVSRLIAMGVPAYMLADSLALTQAQRLVRRLCTYCKKPAILGKDVREIYRCNRIPVPPEVEFIYNKSGCPECHETGYMGRVALMELCAADNELTDLISRVAPLSEMRRVAFTKGMLTLYQEGLLNVLAGTTSLEEISCLSYTAISSSDSGDEEPPVGKIVGMPVDSPMSRDLGAAAEPK